jgi:hypothetical protein
MGSPNGGIIGVINPTSFGKCTQTVTTSSTTLTTQPGTRISSNISCCWWWRIWWDQQVGGGGAGGFRTGCASVCGATGYPITVGGGGAGFNRITDGGRTGNRFNFSTITSKEEEVEEEISAPGGFSGGSGGGGGARYNCSPTTGRPGI